MSMAVRTCGQSRRLPPQTRRQARATVRSSQLWVRSFAGMTRSIGTGELCGGCQSSVPAALRAAISAGSSQAARAASAFSGVFACGGIGRSGTVRENRGAGAG